MSTFSATLLPILFIILTGFILRKSNFIPEDAWSGLEKLTYYILFPALLVGSLGNQSIDGIPWPSMLLVIILTLAVAAALLTLWHLTGSTTGNSTFTSIFQGGIRFNTYIMLAIAQAYFGIEGLTYGAVAAGFMIVLINLLCISALAKWGKTPTNEKAALTREIFGNPLIISCVIGWILSLSGIGLPGITENIIEILGSAALPLGLLAVGAALKPEAIREHLKPVVIASLFQFLLKPLTVIFLNSLFGITGIAAGVLIIAFMTPTAASAYILARQLGGDTETMASIITFQTIMAFLVMPLIAFLTLT